MGDLHADLGEMAARVILGCRDRKLHQDMDGFTEADVVLSGGEGLLRCADRSVSAFLDIGNIGNQVDDRLPCPGLREPV